MTRPSYLGSAMHVPSQKDFSTYASFHTPDCSVSSPLEGVSGQKTVDERFYSPEERSILRKLKNNQESVWKQTLLESSGLSSIDTDSYGPAEEVDSAHVEQQLDQHPKPELTVL